MKKVLLFLILMLQMAVWNAVDAQGLTLSDVQNSGCLRENQRRANGEGQTRTIVLLKEGDILSVQLLNYKANCGTEGFDVTPNMSGGSDGTPCLVTIGVDPISYEDADCVCPYNVSFTVHGLESNSFLFSCWWCEGAVTLTEGEPLVLEDSWDNVSIDGLDYRIHEVMHSAQLTNGKSWAGELNIPSELDYEGQKYIVTHISYRAFEGNAALTSVNIPNNVISIGSSAFAHCTGLTSIVIPEGVKSLGYYVFSGCSSLASITIPNSITSVGSDAFTGTAWYNNQPDGVVYAGGIAYTYKGTMPEGTQIDIKEGTIAIAGDAFCKCNNLTSVTIPGCVSTIGSHAFSGCSNLESVIISEGVENIEYTAFLDCTSLKSIVIPQSVTRIGELAFMRCTALTSATINGAITRMGRWAFAGCTALTHLDISNGVKDIGYKTFGGCSSLRSVTIPGSVTRIGELLFFRCSNLESVVISEGVEAIGWEAFEFCDSLASVTIPNSITSIGDYAFHGCNNLTNVYCYADNVPSTGSGIFYGSSFASATLHVPAGSIDAYKATAPWSGFGSVVGEGRVTIDGLNYYLNTSTYTALLTVGNTWEGELDIPSEVSFYGQAYTVTSMGLSAFFENDKLTKVRIPKTLNNILRWYYTTNPYEDVPTGMISSDHMNPFMGCTALESIEVDEENQSLKSVDGVLFSQDGKGHYYYLTNDYYGTGLYCYPAGARRESYTIPDGVEWIASEAFEHNQYISSLTMPSSLKQICNNVFAGCNNLTDIYCYAENVPVAFDYAFKDFPIASATLHVPAGLVDSYKATAPWNGFGNIVALKADVEINKTNFPDENFRNWVLSQSYGADGVLTEDEIAGIKNIELDRFMGINSLKGIEFFTALTYLNCPSNKVTELDLSGNLALTTLECNNNKLTTINLSKNISLLKLVCVGNNLTMLDLSVCSELTYLACSANQLMELDLSKNTKLTHLECYSNQLKALNLTKNTALTRLHCNNNQLTTLDVSKNMSLTLLQCSHNQLTELDVTNNTALKFLSCTNNKLTTLNISNNNALEGVYCFSNLLTTLDAFGCTSITNITCDDNLLTSLNVSSCVALESLYCTENLLTSLDLSENIALTRLFCYKNKIKGEGMDALVENLPTVSEGKLYIIYFQNDQNKMTKAQVAAAKVKGWTPIYCIYDFWQEYEGCEPTEPVTYTQGQIATIILPTAPDADKGRYYRLDRCEDGQIVFEEVIQPQARTPYIIVPTEDFSIDPSALDLEGCYRDTVSIEGINFIGSYVREEFDCEEGFYIDIIDTTPDCQAQGRPVIGALRAYLQVTWNDPYNQGGTKVPEEKMPIVLHDNGTGIEGNEELRNKNEELNAAVYDLSGRQIINSKSSNRKLQNGIYIENGQKKIR